jgi:hypothetical protein
MRYYDQQSYQVGDDITYVTFGGGRRKVRVRQKSGDIKNGRPGFDGEIIAPADEAGGSAWGYDDQIVDVAWKEHRS